jgi:hypothetical protein
MIWFAESGTPVQIQNNENIVNIAFVKEDAGTWKDPITDPTFTDVEFNDAFAVTYLQPRINLPSLTQKGDFMVAVYPNPVNENQNLHLNLNSPQGGHLTCQIHDVSGRLVNTLSRTISSGSQSILVEMSGLAAGTYQMVWTLDSNRLTQSGTQKLTIVK